MVRIAAEWRRRDGAVIITGVGVTDVTPQGLKLVELAPGVSREQIQVKTGVKLI